MAEWGCVSSLSAGVHHILRQIGKGKAIGTFLLPRICACQSMRMVVVCLCVCVGAVSVI